MASEQNKTLLIIPSQTRYIEYTFKKLYENILEPNKNIDIGCFISDESSLQNIESEVKYIFTLPEYSDHRDGLINELNAINIKIPQILNNKQLLKRYQISTIIHIYYRLFILRMLKENNLIDKYDWFIINRSDLIHTKPIIVENLNIEKVYLPDGEHYGGLPDRFAIIPKKYIEQWLFIYNERFFTDYNLIDYHIEKYGPETMTAYNAEKNNISIKYIPYSFYCISDKKTPVDWAWPNRGSNEVYMPDIKLFVKYPSEYNFALQNKKDSIKNNTSIIESKLENPKTSNDKIAYFGDFDTLDNLDYTLFSDMILVWYKPTYKKEEWRYGLYGIKDMMDSNYVEEDNVKIIEINKHQINLLQSFYYCNNNLRNKEILTALTNNLKKYFIKKIYLYINKKDNDIFINSLIYKEYIHKIELIINENQPTYMDYFLKLITMDEKSIVCICNSDIELYCNNTNIFELLKIQRICYFLTRHELDMSKPLIDNYLGSHDAFIFYVNTLKQNLLNNTDKLQYINYIQNTHGIESVLVLFFKEQLNYSIKNPCMQIILKHHHTTNHRPWLINGLKNVGYMSEIPVDKKLLNTSYHGIKLIADTNIVQCPYKVNPEIININSGFKKVISFSLWGNNKNYTIGAIKNAKLATYFYPEYECWFYVHKETVPNEIIIELEKLDNIKIIYKTGDLTKNKPMTWRFESIDNPEVEINLSRDTDTRITLREVLAVNEWLKSDKIFHIMRDHPDHCYKILGGMFGTKNIKNITSWKYLINENINQISDRMYDQDFLRDIIYPEIVNNSFIHATFNKYENHCKDFPINYCKLYNYVGGYVYADESVSKEHKNKLLNYI